MQLLTLGQVQIRIRYGYDYDVMTHTRENFPRKIKLHEVRRRTDSFEKIWLIEVV